MKKIYFLLLLITSLSCENKKENFNLSLLNGYWEISEVSFPSGQTKPYTVNTTIDYLSINKSEGFLKKMNPGLDGRYTTTNSTLYFTLIENEGLWFLKFKEAYLQNLRIIAIDSNSYTVKNEQNIAYLYKRYFPIAISHE